MQQHWLQLQMFLEPTDPASHPPANCPEIKITTQPILPIQVWQTLSPYQQRQLLTKLLALCHSLLNFELQVQQGEFCDD